MKYKIQVDQHKKTKQFTHSNINCNLLFNYIYRIIRNYSFKLHFITKKRNIIKMELYIIKMSCEKEKATKALNKYL